MLCYLLCGTSVLVYCHGPLRLLSERMAQLAHGVYDSAHCRLPSHVPQDCFYVDYLKSSSDDPGADIFFFDYGVVACWGMTKNQEWTVVRGIAAQV